MSKLFISYAASDDLEAIQASLRNKYPDSRTPAMTMRELRQEIKYLSVKPLSGKSLSGILPLRTEYRCLQVKGYCVFYILRNETVDVVRILPKSQDYLSTLFN